MLDRLRQLHSLRPQHSGRAFARDEGARGELTYGPAEEAPPPEPDDDFAQPERCGLGELVAGEELVTDVGACYVSTTALPLATRRGAYLLGDLLAQRPAALAPYHPGTGPVDGMDFAGAAFLDTETTGLGGGAGVYAFMVGVGTFEALEPGAGAPTHFVVRQFFMRSPAEEPALLAAVGALLARASMTVTFNGRSFDLPLLRTRFSFNRRFVPPWAETYAWLEREELHLDLLFPARRLWKRRLQSCRLINLEERLLGVRRTEQDIPGALIPQVYLDYVRTQDARQLRRVFYHNAEDIVSMTALAAGACCAFCTDEQELAGRDGLDWLSLGAAHDHAGRVTEAEHAYRQALDNLGDPAALADAFARLGALYKRTGRWAEAAATWERWLTTVPGADATPYVELAKYAEWQLHDPAQAAMWAGWALHLVESLPPHRRVPGRRAELEHRLERLQRKQGNL